jgi:hypothetical protein
MRAEQIIKELIIKLPRQNNFFNEEVTVSSLTRSGSTVTVTTASNHNLQTGQFINITGAKKVTPITNLSQSNGVATATTSVDHDLTEGFFDTVEIQGANESDYNGSKKLLEVPNRFTFTYEIDENAPGAATGTDILLTNSAVYDYNDRYQITVTSATEFTFQITGTPYTPGIGNIKVQKNVRISGAVSIERAIDAYTKQAPNNLWAFVVLDDTTTVKDRSVLNDTVAMRDSANDFRMRLMKNFSIYIIVPSTNSIAGRAERDLMEDLEVDIYKSIIGQRLSSGFSEPIWSLVVPIGHGFFDYVGAYYVHRYQFQTTVDILDEDTSIDPPTRAFRDVEIDFFDNENELLAELNTNLDEEPV